VTVEQPDRVPQLRGEERLYFDAARRGELVIQRCEACGTTMFASRVVCVSCGSRALIVVVASGRGTVYSYTIVHRAPFRSMRDQTPYVVALIDLAEGVRVMANVIGERTSDVTIGAQVHVSFESLTAEFVVPQFVLV
jgi:uncharacterized OB-fold protein